MPDRPGSDGEPAENEHPLDRRPPGRDSATVKAVGKLSEALEIVEEARGHLYAFHRLTGTADFAVIEAADLLDGAGHGELATRLRAEIIGRNVLPGRWTFQIVEEYDVGYYATIQALEATVRDDLMAGQRHVYEAELKAERRTPGLAGHEAAP